MASVIIVLQIVGIIGLVILWGYETYRIRQIAEAEEKLGDIETELLNAFNQTATAINTNAASLGRVRDALQEQDRTLAVNGALLDILLARNNITGDVREKLESKILDDLDIRVVIDDDDENG